MKQAAVDPASHLPELAIDPPPPDAVTEDSLPESGYELVDPPSKAIREAIVAQTKKGRCR